MAAAANAERADIAELDVPGPPRMTTTLNVKADVAIVGAGPTGLTSALLLANAGHLVTVVERWPEPYPLPRAVGISHQSLRTLQRAQVINDVLPSLYFTPDGSRRTDILTGDGEVLAVRIDKSESLSGWPERASFYQPDFERTLNARVVTHPMIRLLRGWNATSVETNDADVTVHAVRQNEAEPGELHVRAEYVIGCDGANSVVRTGDLAQIHDLGFSYDWLVVDILPKTPRVFTPHLGQILGPPRPTTMVSGGPGRRRWEFMRLDGEIIDELNRPETAWGLLAPFDVSPENATLERHAVYTFRGLWPVRWRSGRALLAGDAAHLMPPFLGEGMNSGMRDAMAVTWRLDLILRGLAPDSLLDSYGPERIGHVRQIVEQAVGMGRMICITDPVEAEARNARLRAAEAQQHPEIRRVEWRLGEGDWLASDSNAGYLGIQARVETGGRVGLLDDLVPNTGFTLLSRSGVPALTPGVAAGWQRIGGICITFDNGLVDIDGGYARWFADHACAVALVRPDFVVYGTGESIEDAETLIVSLLANLGASVR
jgi:2-polyprenyl-6-methoxyphenol hydroxylase-like FAD-dependent oxidoreductase